MILGPKKKLLFAALVGALLSYGANYLLAVSSDQNQKIILLENAVKNLQASLAEKEVELMNARLLALPRYSSTKAAAVADFHKQVKESETGQGGAQSIANNMPSSVLVLKDLETDSDTDRRSVSEKLNELLSGSTSKEKIAIASRAIFDKARDRDGLPDYALQSMYGSQTDPDLKRVIAQVMSQRGNNTLLDNQIAEVQTRLKSDKPRDRQEALNQLGKMHSSKSVDAIAPYLQDPDTNVKLEALFALRDSGNQKHVAMVEMMVNDPDPSVSSLAGEVISNLKNLSSSARTTYSNSDIQAELPPMANP